MKSSNRRAIMGALNQYNFWGSVKNLKGRYTITASYERQPMRLTVATTAWFPRAGTGAQTRPRPGRKKNSKQPRSLVMVGNLDDLS